VIDNKKAGGDLAQVARRLRKLTPMSISTPDTESKVVDHRIRYLVNQELEAIVARAARAQRRLREPQTPEEWQAAEAELWEARGELHAARSELAELGLYLLRFALDMQPDALRALLTQALRPELESLAEAVMRRGGAA
jgi:hypothetical protein